MPRRATATGMAFGAGVLLAAPAVDVMDDARRTGGFPAVAAGFAAWTGAYTAAH